MKIYYGKSEIPSETTEKLMEYDTCDSGEQWYRIGNSDGILEEVEIE